MAVLEKSVGAAIITRGMNRNRAGSVPHSNPPAAVSVLICFAGALMTLVGSAASFSTPTRLNIGDVYELRRDGWSNPPSGAAYEGDVLPKTDANDGSGKDNPLYRRHNVARAWPTDVGYWFTSADQNEDEPDPAGEQWVDYAPPIEILGPGRYSIDASYRWSTNRAPYPAVYRIYHALGTNEVQRDQRIGSPTAAITYFSLGEFELRPGSFVRVEDTGTGSITFANMRFRLLAPEPQLQITYQDEACELRWPTNAVGYRVEFTQDLSSATNWLPHLALLELDGDWFRTSVSVTNSSQYFFRLVKP